MAFVNLRSVGNVTWVNPRHSTPDAAGALLAFDTGPANAPINDLMRARRGVDVDTGGALGAEGAADAEVVARFMQHPYFDKVPPKSLDRNSFHGFVHTVAPLNVTAAASPLPRLLRQSVGPDSATSRVCA